MNFTQEYLDLGGPVPDGWHHRDDIYIWELWGNSKVLYTVTDEAVRYTGRDPAELYLASRLGYKTT